MQNLRTLIFLNVSLAVAYFIGGYAGIQLAVPPSQASPVWPAAGIALAGLFTYGAKAIPGVFVGALAAQLYSFLDLSSPDKALSSLGIAILSGIGGMAQAWIGAQLINRLIGEHDPLIEDRKIFRLMLLIAPLCCTVSSTIGIASLYARNIVKTEELLSNWTIWWAGDVIGVVIFAPLLLLFIGKPRKLWRARRRFVAYPLIGALLIVVGIFHYNVRQERLRINALFETQVKSMHDELQSRLDTHLKINEIIKAFYASSGFVNPDEFKQFAGSILAGFPSVKTIEWLPKITHARRHELEAQQFNIREYDQSGRLQPAPIRDSYFPIYFFESYQDHRQVLGLDIATHALRELLNDAINRNQVVVTRNAEVLQPDADASELSILTPLYQKQESLQTLEQRQANFRGFVATSFSLATNVSDILKLLTDVRLFLEIRESQGTLIFSNVPRGFDQQINYFHLNKSEPLLLAGQTWILQYQPSESFFYSQRSNSLWWLLFGGLLLCALTGLGLLLLTGRTERVEEMVYLKTRDLLLTNQQLNQEIDKRLHLQREQESRSMVLEALAKGYPLETILDLIATNAGQLYSGLLCSILLVDVRQRCLRIAAASNLPELYSRARDCIEIAPNVGACGSAAYYRKTVIVEDIATAKFSHSFKELLLQCNLRACWSEPILASDGRVLGVFVNYYQTSKIPDVEHLQFMKNMAQLIAIAVERKEAETSLRENQRILQEAQEVANLGHYIADVESATWQGSQVLDKILGIDEHFVKTFLSMEHLIHPEFLAQIHAQILETLEQQGRFDQAFKIIRGDDAAERWVSVLGQADFDDSGKAIRIIGTVQDITQRKLADLELEHHRDHLQELVEVRTQDLVKAKEIAEQSNRAKSMFLSNMSHELRTPMHAILSFGKLGMGKSEQENCSVAKLHHYFECIVTSSERLMPLINDLLDLSKLESGKLHLTLGTYDLLELVRKVVNEINILAVQKNILIDMREVASGLRVECEEHRIMQVIRNLLSNAIKFSPQESSIRLVAMPAVLNGRRENDDFRRPAIALEVIDAGIGIPESELETVFHEFVQSSKTRTAAGGTGLGLAICREIIATHGGTIQAFNNEEKGCRIRMVLPLAQAEVGFQSDT